MSEHKIKNAFTEIKFFKRGNVIFLEITFLKIFPENYYSELVRRYLKIIFGIFPIWLHYIITN